MRRVKFIRPAAPYGRGDVAGLDDAIAERAIGAGLAVPDDVGLPPGPERPVDDSRVVEDERRAFVREAKARR